MHANVTSKKKVWTKWSEKEELEWKWDEMLALAWEPEFYLKILQKVGTDKKLTFKEWFIKKLWKMWGSITPKIAIYIFYSFLLCENSCKL